MGRACISLSCGYLGFGVASACSAPVSSLQADSDGRYKPVLAPVCGRGARDGASCGSLVIPSVNLISANAVKISSMAAREIYDGPTPELPLGGPSQALQRWLDITYHSTSYNVRSRQMLCGLVEKVAAAGSWAAYERAHRMQLARIFAPKLPRIPKYVVPTVVAYWAHTGYY